MTDDKKAQTQKALSDEWKKNKKAVMEVALGKDSEKNEQE